MKKWTIGLLLAAAVTAAAPIAFADEPPEKVARGLYNAKELLLLMDQDRNGKVSREEFMRFMEAEFDALDVNKDGSLDVAELTGIRVRRSKPSNHK